jgi:hypothetical protein
LDKPHSTPAASATSLSLLYSQQSKQCWEGTIHLCSSRMVFFHTYVYTMYFKYVLQWHTALKNKTNPSLTQSKANKDFLLFLDRLHMYMRGRKCTPNIILFNYPQDRKTCGTYIRSIKFALPYTLVSNIFCCEYLARYSWEHAYVFIKIVIKHIQFKHELLRLHGFSQNTPLSKFYQNTIIHSQV